MRLSKLLLSLSRLKTYDDRISPKQLPSATYRIGFFSWNLRSFNLFTLCWQRESNLISSCMLLDSSQTMHVFTHVETRNGREYKQKIMIMEEMKPE